MKHYFQPTQDQIDKMQGWLYDGLSMSQIGTRLGVTRNVISGVIWRRPVLREIQRKRFGSVAIASQSRREKIITKFLDSAGPATMVKEPDKPAEPQVPAKKGVPLKDLGAFMCKYPVIWDDDTIGGWRFCGDRTRPDEVYCPKHRLMIRQRKQEDRT